MKKKARVKAKDEIVDIIHGILKFHTKNQDLSFGDIVALIYGIYDPQQLSNSQVLEVIEGLLG